MTHRPRTHRYSVTLSRYDVFPLDMLRFGESWPLTADDAGLIHALIARDDEQIARLPKKVTINLGTLHDPSPLALSGFDRIKLRWESFSIRVSLPEGVSYPEIEEEEAIGAIKAIRRLMASRDFASIRFQSNVIDDTCASLADKLPRATMVSVRALCRSDRTPEAIAKLWFQPEEACA